MSSLFALDELIDMIQNNNNQCNRKGNAQSSVASKFKCKEIDKNVDRTLLKKLQKYKVINPYDISDREKSPEMEDILSKYLSLINKHNAKNGHIYKLLVLVRHGEGMHNWAKWELFGPEEWLKNQSTNLKWKDPHLTKLGITQAKQLLPRLHCLQSHLDLIVASPLNRALETATYAFLPFVELENSESDNEEKQSEIHKYKCPVYVLEYIRERINHHACDSRSDFDVIQKEWKQYDFKYEGFDTNKDVKWNNKADERRELLWKRSAKMMDFVWEKECNIVIYSGHCDFIMSLMEVIVDMPFYKPRNGSYFPIIITTV